jgi:hypothetical protein
MWEYVLIVPVTLQYDANVLRPKFKFLRDSLRPQSLNILLLPTDYSKYFLQTVKRRLYYFQIHRKRPAAFLWRLKDEQLCLNKDFLEYRFP